MKYLISTIILALAIAGCQNPNGNGNGNGNTIIPEDIGGKKRLLKEKQKELKDLTNFINSIQSQIDSIEPKEKTRELVTVIPVEKTDFKRYVEIQGSVQSDEFVNVSSEIPGRILQLNVKEGQNVKKGQLIAKIDVETIEKQIAELEKSLELASDVFERQSRLWKQNIGSEIQYLQAKNNKERLEKGIESARFQLSKANVYAPISGVVEKKNAKSGEMASPGFPLVIILNTGKVKVAADVPEAFLHAVKKGETVAIKFPAINLERQGRISRIGSVIHPSNRTFSVEVNFSNGNHLLKPNLLALMLINDFSKENVITIPLELVQQEVSGKDFVFVKAEGDNGLYAKKVYIETGESYLDRIIVNSGIEENQELIFDGARSLVEGDLIDIKSGNE